MDHNRTTISYLRRPQRGECIFLAILVLIFGVLGAALPFAPYDWLQQRITAQLNTKGYEGDAVVIAIDDDTISYLDDKQWDKNDLAKLLLVVRQGSPKQIIVDRQFFEGGDQESSDALRKALESLPKKPIWRVELSSSDAASLPDLFETSKNLSFATSSEKLDPDVQRRVVPAVMTLQPWPLGTPVFAPFAAQTSEGIFPSVANLMAEGRRPENNIFNIDLSYDPASVPRISAKNILDDEFNISVLDKKRVIVGFTDDLGRDTINSPQDSYTPRVVAAVLAAQTLLDGPPTSVGWFPAFFAGLIAAFTWTFVRRPFGRLIAISILLVIICSPVVFERYLILQQTSHGVLLVLLFAIGKLWQRARGAIQTYRSAAETKSRFLAQASHDLRQPIHAIGLLADRLSQTDLSEGQSEIVSKISWSVDNASRMFRALLDIAAIESGTLQSEVGPIAVNELLAEIDSQNALVAEQAGVDLRLVPSDLIIKTDRALLGTMLQNLVSNAIKYSPQKQVVVGCRRNGKTISLWVVDNGRGISAAELEHVQEEFYRSSSKSSIRSENKGLGLAIVNRLTKMLGLKFSLASREGRGTAAGIIGLQPVSAKEQNIALDTIRKLPLSGIKVVIADDDAETLKSTEQLLEQWGCGVRSYSVFPDHVDDVDVLLTDFDFGDGNTLADNRDTIEEITARGKHVIIISGHHPDQVRAMLKNHRGLILSKPLRAAELRSALMSTLVQ